MRKAICLSAFVVASTLAACGGSDSTPPPEISNQPLATSAFSGGSATLTVQATGSGLTYQWQRNGAPIAGAVDASYTLTSVSAADQGASYTVVVANSGGSWAATIDAPTLPVDATGWTIDAQFAAARTRYLGPDASIGSYDDQATGSLRLTARFAPADAGKFDETHLIAPAAGLTFTNNRLGSGGTTATLQSGTYLARERYDPVSPDFDGETELRHEALRFDVDGVPYLAQGSRLIKYDKDGNIVDTGGEMVVTSNGLRVGRIFGTNTPAPGFYYEVDGEIVPLAAATVGVAPAAARAGGSTTAAARRVGSPARATIANGGSAD